MRKRDFDKRRKRVTVRTGIRAGVPTAAGTGTVSDWLEHVLQERRTDETACDEHTSESDDDA